MTDTATFVTPGSGGGLLEVVRRRYLLRLLVHKELRQRYHGSVLGMGWSYMKPAVQFGVYYFVIGVFLKMNANIENYGIYLFSGIIAMNFFSEAFSNATRSITDNYALVKKIYLPRELFPVASVLVSFVHFLPQLFVLVLGCLFTGWSPNLAQIIGGVGGFLLLAAFVLGLGLVFGALNVLYRDFENLVDLILVVATWASPVLYTWTLVTDAIGTGWLWWLYQSNPLTTVVEIFHWCFWAPTTSAPLDFPPGFPAFLAIAVAVTALTVATGQLIFRRLDGRFAQEL
ncbi:MAG: ABC transporter permease [Phycicoccus sp.]|nr:ABC transporter permease [Phycicoccus sp.]